MEAITPERDSDQEQDRGVQAHQTSDDTDKTIGEEAEESLPLAPPQIGETANAKPSQCRPDKKVSSSPQIEKISAEQVNADEDSGVTSIAEDSHSSPKPSATAPSSSTDPGTPLIRTISQYRRDEKEAQQKDANVHRVVYRIPSNLLQEIRRGKKEEIADEDSLEAYRRKVETEIKFQEGVRKQSSHALRVIQERGEQGSEQHVDAERLLLIAS